MEKLFLCQFLTVLVFETARKQIFALLGGSRLQATGLFHNIHWAEALKFFSVLVYLVTIHTQEQICFQRVAFVTHRMTSSIPCCEY